VTAYAGHLTIEQDSYARARAWALNERNRNRPGTVNRYGLPANASAAMWELGVRAEVAASVVYEVELQPDGFGDRHSPDVGWFDVRATPYRTGGLLVHPDDVDDRPILLVIIGVGAHGTSYRMAGWCWGHEAKQARWWWVGHAGRAVRWPCYRVPQAELRPPASLALAGV
jgi:hypothetical protein